MGHYYIHNRPLGIWILFRMERKEEKMNKPEIKKEEAFEMPDELKKMLLQAELIKYLCQNKET